MKKLLLLAFAASALAACSDDDKMPTPPQLETISFSEVELGAGGYLWGKTLGTDFDGMLFSTADQNLVFNAYYSSLYDGWGGIGLSRMPDRNAAAPSSKQQFSVWADGGANGTETYAVFYDSNSPTEMYPEYLSESGYPTIDLVEPRIVAHLYIANSTWVYNYFTGADTDSFQVKITGSLGGVEKGSITETLVAGKSKLSGWRKVDLSSLGAVDKLVFKAVCDYLADPTYFCVDEIGLLKPDAM